MPSDITIITFGCRLNSYESEIMREHAAKAGLHDIVIFNGCAVTAEAERQLRQSIRKAKRENPNLKVIVTGCAAQINPDHYAQMNEVDFVVGNDAKMKLETFRDIAAQIAQHPQDLTPIWVSDIQKIRETALHLVQGFEGRTRAFVQVQNGCDHRCTFCIIPQGRGPSRSVAPKEIVEQIRILVDQGYPEIALTGVDIASYGKDLSHRLTLGQLVQEVLAKVPALQWLRLSSLDPAAIDEALWQAWEQDERLLPYMHLSLQAGDDDVLKRMARRHRRKDVFDLCDRGRSIRSDMTFGADLIAGFPTETDEMFANTLELVKETDITWLHVFPYSARKGTHAARLTQVPVAERKARAAMLREVGQGAVTCHVDALIGKEMLVHVEKPSLGRTPTFAEAVWEGEAVIGTLIKVRGLARCDDKLVVERIGEEGA
ncbi:MAG: tRNA (N(6)-L-threonylcarbamoyladenosine(37)-C(2))-methylthiotransferase MtaB [Proteobacteria bacterium]|nr:tRNA (N(6)-L-threonylcarbamoyladenosine(37)-C(2))-methylthiotransferase MtaB [Pseudomonadota bacterium]